MPCYNGAAFLRSAIESVLNQDYLGPVQLIVVDDGSSDESVAIASGFPQVLVLSQTNQGPAAARNLAIDQAKGEFIAFLDADDLWMPGSLRARIEAFEHGPEIGVVFGNFTRWTPSKHEGEEDQEIPDPLPASVQSAISSGMLYPAILLDPIVHIITIVARREVFDKVGRFDTALRLGEDYEFWIRASRQFRFKRVDMICSRYRMHAASTTRTPRAVNYEMRVVESAIYRFGICGADGTALDQRALKQRQSELCFKHGYLHFWHGSASVSFCSFRQALKFRPGRAKAWMYAALSFVKLLFRRSRSPAAHV
jgi:glycosyltransferase involved in cell wall biosynthesis